MLDNSGTKLPGIFSWGCWLILMILAVSPLSGAEFDSIALEPMAGEKTTDLKSYRGKIVLVNFWAIWCVPCRYEFPELEALSNKYRDEDVIILGVTAETSRKKVSKYIKKMEVTFPILLDKESLLHKAVNLEVMPSTILLDRQGRIFKTYQGFSRSKGLKEIENDLVELKG